MEEWKTLVLANLISEHLRKNMIESQKAPNWKPHRGLSLFLYNKHLMQSLFIQYVYLILIILALVMIANKLRLAYPIVLVLGGLALSFTSVFSHVTIDPEAGFLYFSSAASI